MKITVHRPNQIGGCITEIESKNGTRIVIDVGSNLPGNEDAPAVNIEEMTKGCAGVFITHYHGDHIGEFERVDKNVPIYMGKDAHTIFETLCNHLPDKNIDLVRSFKTFQKRDQIAVGDMVVTPYRVDHSAYDAYMFLIECDGKKVLHTGDFRTHGWTGKGVTAMLKHYVKKVDIMICEGTMLSRRNKEIYAENDLRSDALKLFKQHRQVFILCSSTNIDSIASFYKAADKEKLLVVVDPYQYDVLQTVTKSAVSNMYSFPYVKIYCPGQEDCIKEMERRGFCMFVRYNDYNNKFRDIMNMFPNHLFIYSMWSGYLEEKTRNVKICDFVPKKDNGEFDCHELHTSGHVYEEALVEVCNTVKPEIILPIHGENPERLETLRQSGRIEQGTIKRFEGVKGTFTIQ